jgi:hypothetical protein
MCYSQGLSFFLGVVGLAATRWLFVRDRRRLAGIFLFYTCMEWLQFLGYWVAGDCGGRANVALTLVAHFFVVIQPYMWNRFRSGNETEPCRKAVFDFAATMALVWALFYTLRLVPDLGGEVRDTPSEIMVSAPAEGMCTLSGPSHIAWMLPYRAWYGLEPNLFAYLLIWFLPIFYESDRALLKAGVWVVQVAFVFATSRSMHELPSTWCAMSVPILSLIVVKDVAIPWVRRRFAW